MVVRELINAIGFKLNESELRRVESRVENALNKIGNTAKKMTLFVTTPFVLASNAMLKTAGDANELQNMFNQVFTGMEQEANRWAKTYADSLNRADFKTKESLAIFQSFFKGLEFGTDQAYGFSKQLVSLVDDFGSFRNLSPEESQQRFISALSGSAEVMDRFGINLRQASIEQELLAMGIAKSVTKATEQEKVMARINIIAKSMGRQGAIGDAQRTMLEYANITRSGQSRFKELVTLWGQELIPVATKMWKVLLRLMQVMRDDVSPEMRKVLLTVGALASVIGPATLALVGLATAGLGVSKVFRAIATSAKLANLSTMAFLGKFLIIGAAVAVVVGSLILAFEDLFVYLKGGDSLVGKFIEPWEKLGPRIKNALKPIKEAYEETFDGIKTTVESVIRSLFFMTQGNVEETKKSLMRLKDGIVEIFSGVADIIVEQMKLKIELMIKSLTNIKLPGVQSAKNIGTVLGTLANEEVINPALSAEKAKFSRLFADPKAEILKSIGINNTGSSQNKNAVFNVNIGATVNNNGGQVDSASVIADTIKVKIDDYFSNQVNNLIADF